MQKLKKGKIIYCFENDPCDLCIGSRSSFKILNNGKIIARVKDRAELKMKKKHFFFIRQLFLNIGKLRLIGFDCIDNLFQLSLFFTESMDIKKINEIILSVLFCTMGSSFSLEKNDKPTYII